MSRTKSGRVASVLARLRNLACEHGVVYNEILARYAIERILRKLQLSRFGKMFILKGGMMSVVWGRGFNYRPTMDVDLEFRGRLDEGKAREMFVEIAGTESGDDLEVDAGSVSAATIRDGDEYGGFRVSMTAHLGKVRLPVQIDIGLGDAITPAAKMDEFPVLLDCEAPRIRVYSRETAMAEKLQTIVRRGHANSRMKDYFDLYMLSLDEMVDGETLKNAVARTFERRRTELPVGRIPDGLSEEFAANKAKQAQWDRFIKKNRLNDAGLSLSAAVRHIREYLSSLGVI